MSVTRGPNLENEERRKQFEELLSTLESLDEARIRELEEAGLSNEELASILLELVMEEEKPTEFFGEPRPANLQRNFFSRKASPT